MFATGQLGDFAPVALLMKIYMVILCVWVCIEEEEVSN